MKLLEEGTTWRKPLSYYEEKWEAGECEACHKLFDKSDLIWDLKEDRMVCIQCYARFKDCPIFGYEMEV